MSSLQNCNWICYETSWSFLILVDKSSLRVPPIHTGPAERQTSNTLAPPDEEEILENFANMVKASINGDDVRPSGVGILEFSPEKAGQDVTPANYAFESKPAEKRNSGTFSSIAGKWNDFFSWIFLDSLIAMFMGPTCGPSGADRTQVGPMTAPWTLLSGLTQPNVTRVMIYYIHAFIFCRYFGIPDNDN